MPSFAISITVLTLVQAGVVVLPAARTVPFASRLRTPGWAVVPGGSIVAFVLVVRASSQSAQGLTYLALVAVPPLAALGLGWALRGARVRWAGGVVALAALAWIDRNGLVGETAALVLTGLSCVTLAVLLAGLASAVWLKVGIVAMAALDSWFVISDLLQAPNNALNAAAPAAGLPALQSAVFGSAVMGYGDLFVAALLGAVLALELPRQRWASVIAAALGLAFDLLFFVVRELPATVPIAVTLIVVELWAWLVSRRKAAAR